MRGTDYSSRWGASPGYAAGLGLILAMGLAMGCAAPNDPTPPPSRNIQSPDLGLSIVDLPPEWTVLSNDADGLRLSPSGTDRQGTIRLTVGEEEAGINLVLAVENHQADIESREGGAYSGAQELAGPLGTAFYSRGRYTKNGAVIEETRIVGIHPSASRPLTVDYSYPAGEDSSARVSELIELFALIE